MLLLERKAQFYMKLEHPILSAKHTVKLANNSLHVYVWF